jgi:sulfur transfer protein SufE
MKKTKSNMEKLLEHLKKGRSITALQAFQWWKTMTIRNRISELRRQGYNIKTETIRKDGKSYARWSIA